MTEPIWISRDLAESIHHDQLKDNGGSWGIRDENLLESALARPQQRWSYGPDADLFDLAAAYAFGIAKNHPFIDGNKRTAFVTMAAFLIINGHQLGASEVEAVATMLGVADSSLDESGLAAWCRANSEALGSASVAGSSA